MLDWFKAQLLVDAQGQPPAVVRQILLTNLTAALAAIITAIYQLFYLVYDIVYFLPLFSANLLFIGSYAAAMLLNRAGRFNAARNLAIATIVVHLFVATYFISSAAGVHLFYFTLAGIVALMFALRNNKAVLTCWVLCALLFVSAHFAFTPGTTPLTIPSPYIDIMYAGSAVGAMALAGILAQLFRLEIDRAESALISSNRELERISGIDSLTGLANRRTMDAYLEREWRRLKRLGLPLSVLLFDVDYFKAYNDHYGHPSGDKCLQQVAATLSGIVQRSGDLVVRYGGEEFVILLSGTGAEDAVRIAEQARLKVQALAIRHAYSDVLPQITLSAGVASAVPDSLDNTRALLRLADEGLYAAKRHGRNRVMVDRTRSPDSVN